MAITKNVEGESKNYWEAASAARKKVEGWPEWKRSIPVSKYSTDFKSQSNKNDIKKDGENTE